MVDLISPTIEIFERVGKLIVKVKELYKGFDNELHRLQSLIKLLEPPMEELRHICGDAGVASSKTDNLTDRGKKQIAELHQLLVECKKLLEECTNCNRSKPFKITEYSERLKRSRENLQSFISIYVEYDNFVASIIRDINTGLSRAAPLPPDLIVGFKEPLEELRRKLLESPQKVFGICGMGGSGKTTLAAMVCNDDRVTAKYREPIFLKVSSSPDLETACQKLLEKFNHRVVEGGATNGLARYLSQRTDKKLVVLDDVIWSDMDIETLVNAIQKAAHFKILITSRTKLKVCEWSYPVKSLSEDDARKLFEHHALPLGEGNPKPDQQLIDEIVESCKRHPLVLKVIGRSLAKEDGIMWQSVADMLAQTGSIISRHDEILTCLTASFKSLTKEEYECFLDLGAFPKSQAIPANILIDMWTETAKLNQMSPYEILNKLHRRNLVSIIDRKGGDAWDPDRSFSSLLVAQHDLLRELAIHESKKEGEGQTTRLIMELKEGIIPDTWMGEKGGTSQAKLVSIISGDMNSLAWPDIELPNAEVLILNFSAASYCLPPFLQSMENLKFLVVTNHGSNRAVLDELSQLSSLNKLKRVIFTKISLPAEPLRKVEGGSRLRSSLQTLWKFVGKVTSTIIGASAEQPLKLHKLSLVLCDVRHLLHIPSLFPSVKDLEIDYCTELDELPEAICDISNIEKLSITNFPDLLKLPDGIGKLHELKVLRLHACGKLKHLPHSLSQLSELRFLDISYCSSLDAFPEGMENLRCLKKIDMRSCLSITELPSSMVQLKERLERVVCDEETAALLESCGFDERKLDKRPDKVDLGFLY